MFSNGDQMHLAFFAMFKYSIAGILAFIITAIAWVAVPSNSLADVPYIVIQLTDNDVDDVSPQINNNGAVIWLRHDQSHSREGKRFYLFKDSYISELPFAPDKKIFG